MQPIDRYIKAVSVCNGLALIVSQCTSDDFIPRMTLLIHLHRYWTKGGSVHLTPDHGTEEEPPIDDIMSDNVMIDVKPMVEATDESSGITDAERNPEKSPTEDLRSEKVEEER